MIGMSSGEKNITITKWHKRLSSHSSSVLDLEKIAAQVKAGLHVRASAYGKEVAIKLAIEAIKAKRREL